MISKLSLRVLRGIFTNSPGKSSMRGLLFPKIVFAGVCLALLTIGGCGSWHQEDSGMAFSSPIEFYQGPLDHLHAVREGGCPMYPSCSAYAKEAFETHGPVRGWVMAHDRVLRCGRNETDLTRRIHVNGNRLYYDPVDRNDFWGYKSNATDS